MIKRSPQEVADFFGCHVVKDSDLSWLLFLEEPVRVESAKTWDGNHSGRIYEELVDSSEGFEEKTIYKPQPVDAIEVFKKLQERKRMPHHIRARCIPIRNTV